MGERRGLGSARRSDGGCGMGEGLTLMEQSIFLWADTLSTNEDARMPVGKKSFILIIWNSCLRTTDIDKFPRRKKKKQRTKSPVNLSFLSFSISVDKFSRMAFQERKREREEEKKPLHDQSIYLHFREMDTMIIPSLPL